ncbi:MAG: DciA family protein [Gemmatimonadales bacterium]
MKPRSRPSPLGDLVGAYLDKRGFTERIDLVSAVDRWAEVVGERVAANARADGVTADGQLWVIVRSSAWAAELSLMAPRILARLNEGRDGRITALRCRVGPVEAPPKPEAE